MDQSLASPVRHGDIVLDAEFGNPDTGCDGYCIGQGKLDRDRIVPPSKGDILQEHLRQRQRHPTIPSAQDKGICRRACRCLDPNALGFEVFADGLYPAFAAEAISFLYQDGIM